LALGLAVHHQGHGVHLVRKRPGDDFFVLELELELILSHMTQIFLFSDLELLPRTREVVE
jgi:hypothetical protein